MLSGAQLKKIRESMGLTQEQFSVWIGVTSNSVARWERGERAIGGPLEILMKTAPTQIDKVEHDLLDYVLKYFAHERKVTQNWPSLRGAVHCTDDNLLFDALEDLAESGYVVVEDAGTGREIQPTDHRKRLPNRQFVVKLAARARRLHEILGRQIEAWKGNK